MAIYALGYGYGDVPMLTESRWTTDKAVHAVNRLVDKRISKSGIISYKVDWKGGFKNGRPFKQSWKRADWITDDLIRAFERAESAESIAWDTDHSSESTSQSSFSSSSSPSALSASSASPVCSRNSADYTTVDKHVDNGAAHDKDASIFSNRSPAHKEDRET